MLLVLSIAIADETAPEPAAESPAAPAAPVWILTPQPKQFYIPMPPILYITGDPTALVVNERWPWGDGILAQTPGWVSSPAGDALRGVPLAEVPYYVDGLRQW